jgi:hypothetical protein
MSSDTPAKPSRLPGGSRVVIAILCFAVIFGLALSLCVYYVVGNMKDSVDAYREAAKSESVEESDGKSAKTDAEASRKNPRDS